MRIEKEKAVEKRKGARRRSEVPAEVRQGLNNGTLETANLVEGLVVDCGALLGHVAPELPPEALAAVGNAQGITRKMRLAGEMLAAEWGIGGYDRFASHSSDTVRGWAAYLMAAVPGLTLRQRLARIRVLADDPHFAVREWAWIATRGAVAADVHGAVRLLAPWTGSDSANIRRFAAEITRPRGVWCAHVGLLKEEPELGLPLLEPLRSDGSKYVRDSVANWLKDAGKTRPDWVSALCSRWARESRTPETAHVVARATRSL